MYPRKLRYTHQHEWVRIDSGTLVVGITEYALQELGEIVFIELPVVDTYYPQMAEFGSVESVKAVSSLYSPVSGKISAVNNLLLDNPGLLNEDPYEEAWIAKIQISDEQELGDLMSHKEYEGHIDSL